MATSRDEVVEIVLDVFQALGALRSTPIGGPPAGPGAAELAATLEATATSVAIPPRTERQIIAKRIFDQWKANDPGPLVLQISGGDKQQAPAGAAVATPVSVSVSDRSGQPAIGVPVFFAVTGGNGTVARSRQTTDAKGIATAGARTLGAMPGENTLAARSSAGGEVTFTATGILPSGGSTTATGSGSSTSKSTGKSAATSSP
jgi:hypothetical protein